MVRLMTSLETCDESIAKQLIKGKTNQDSDPSVREAYAIIEEIFQQFGLLNYIEHKWRNQKTNKPTDGPADQNFGKEIIRHYYNTEIRFIVHGTDSLKAGNLVWIIGASLPNGEKQSKGGKATSLCSNYLAILSQQNQPLTVLKRQLTINSTYELGYFNTLSCLWKRAYENRETSAILMHQNDSAAMALKNMLNRHHYIIILRELLVQKGIRIHLATREEWSNIMSRLAPPPTMTTTTTTHQDGLDVQACNRPDVQLRHSRNQQLRIVEKFKAQRTSGLVTKTMRDICPLAEKWTNIPLGQISNQIIIMMTGLVSNGNRALVNGEVESEAKGYPGCSCNRDADRDTTSSTIHRLIRCTESTSTTVLPKRDQGLEKARAVFMERDKSATKTEVLKALTRLAMSPRDH